MTICSLKFWSNYPPHLLNSHSNGSPVTLGYISGSLPTLVGARPLTPIRLQVQYRPDSLGYQAPRHSLRSHLPRFNTTTRYWYRLCSPRSKFHTQCLEPERRPHVHESIMHWKSVSLVKVPKRVHPWIQDNQNGEYISQPITLLHVIVLAL